MSPEFRKIRHAYLAESLKLQRLLRANEGLSMAYQLKEQFKGIFQYQKQGWALRALDHWCAMAQASNLSPFQRLRCN